MCSRLQIIVFTLATLSVAGGCSSLRPDLAMEYSKSGYELRAVDSTHPQIALTQYQSQPAPDKLERFDIKMEPEEPSGPTDFFDFNHNGGEGYPACKKRKSREALFEWAIGPEQPEEENGEEEEEPIVTDRPDFTEASKAVGKGRIQLEMGYTYIRDREGGTSLDGHSYPEALLRIGLFTDWFELRIAQNFGNERSGLPDFFTRADGAEDLYLGARFDLTEQKGWLPESSIIFQMTVPTGSAEVTTNAVMPGANLIYGWDVLPDRIGMAGSTQVNKALDDRGDFFAEFAQSFTIAYTLTKKVGAYTEWFGLFPVGASDPSAGPKQFFNGGFTYLVTNDLQLDIRAGVGLNDRSEDFFTGAGFAYRY